jgi:hypothetical protein
MIEGCYSMAPGQIGQSPCRAHSRFTSPGRQHFAPRSFQIFANVFEKLVGNSK